MSLACPVRASWIVASCCLTSPVAPLQTLSWSSALVKHEIALHKICRRWLIPNVVHTCNGPRESTDTSLEQIASTKQAYQTVSRMQFSITTTSTLERLYAHILLRQQRVCLRKRHLRELTLACRDPDSPRKLDDGNHCWKWGRTCNWFRNLHTTHRIQSEGLTFFNSLYPSQARKDRVHIYIATALHRSGQFAVVSLKQITNTNDNDPLITQEQTWGRQISLHVRLLVLLKTILQMVCNLQRCTFHDNMCERRHTTNVWQLEAQQKANKHSGFC